MASRNFLVLIAIALVPFAIARQNPSDKEASQIDLPQQDGLYEPLGWIKPPHNCLKHPPGATELEGTGEYEPSGLWKSRCPPPPPPPEAAPPTSPGPILEPILAPIRPPTVAPSPPLILTPIPTPALPII